MGTMIWVPFLSKPVEQLLNNMVSNVMCSLHFDKPWQK